MAKTDFKSVDQYLATQPDAVRGVLEQVRSVLRKALPGATEIISYQIPAFRLPEGMVLFFAGWKKHYSVYPVTAGVLAAFGEELAAYELSKGTIRFRLDKPVPKRLIAGIAKVRAGETIARKAVRKTKPKKTARTAAKKKKR